MKTVPWKMTREKFAASLRFRVSHMYSPTFEEFTRSMGVPPEELPSDTDVANYIGGSLTERTRAGRGKLSGLRKKFDRLREVSAEYEKARASGAVKLVDVQHPIDVHKPMDAAYARALHRRSVVLAIGRGEKVPARVLRDYPDLSKKTGRPAR